MKKYFIAFCFLIFFPVLIFPQIIYNQRIDSVINLVSPSVLAMTDRQLSGDTISTIGGSPYLIFSRLHSSPSNIKAAQYIYEKFQSYGLTARYQSHSPTNINVIARKTGYKYPYRKFIITAHYDNMLSGSPSPLDTVHGADDNASGVIAVLEAARLLTNYNMPYTVEFVAFDEEEIGLRGSYGYADTCLLFQDTLMAVLNMDMIGWDGNNDGMVRIMTTQFCDIIADMLINCYQRYNISLQAVKMFNSGGSDHIPFWYRGFPAITSIEPQNDFHPYYHTIGDDFSTINMNYLVKNTKANIAALMSLATENYYMIQHNPVQSGMDTSAQTAGAYIFYPIPYGTGNNAPRLYYKINNGTYQYVNAYQIIGYEYYFRIPGQPLGTKVSYYIAAQDSAGIYPLSSPPGAGGINPPGTTPPPAVHTYYIWNIASHTSNCNKPILDNQYTRDTIHITQQGIIEDIEITLNINHSNDGDLLITLVKDQNVSNLSQFNGTGGQNYTNTVFDDSASISIIQGTPPLTGRFKPQVEATGFLGIQMQGDWILRIYDINAGNTGTLLNWSIGIKYSSQVSVKKEENTVANNYMLYQNYPNPFNPSTNIRFDIPKSTRVSLKIYDLAGREVASLVNEFLNKGSYSVNYNASSLPSGVYFYRLETYDFSSAKKMILLK